MIDPSIRSRNWLLSFPLAFASLLFLKSILFTDGGIDLHLLRCCARAVAVVGEENKWSHVSDVKGTALAASACLLLASATVDAHPTPVATLDMLVDRVSIAAPFARAAAMWRS